MHSPLKKRLASLEIENANILKTISQFQALFDAKDKQLLQITKQLDQMHTENSSLKGQVSQLKETVENIYVEQSQTNPVPKQRSQGMRSADRRGSVFIIGRPPSNPRGINPQDEQEDKGEETQGPSGLDSPAPSISKKKVGFDFIRKDLPELHINHPDIINAFPIIEEKEESKEEGFNSAKLRTSVKKLRQKSMRDMGLKDDFFDRGTFKPKKIFENFYVTGVTKRFLEEKLLENKDDIKTMFRNGETMRFNGIKIYDQSENRKVANHAKIENLEKYVAPNGFCVTRHALSSKETKCLFDKVVFKGLRKYSKRFIVPLKPHTTEVMLSNWDSYIEGVNFHNKMYLIGITKGDYFLVTEKKTTCLVYAESSYSFLTYYPLPNLFFWALSTILNIIKSRRKSLFTEDKGGAIDYSKMDFDVAIKIFHEEISDYLEQLFQTPCPSPNSTIKYILGSDQWYFRFPEAREFWLDFVTWKAWNVFTKFGLDDILWIMSCILLEKNIAFFSEELTLLTATINTFLGLLCPFKYLCISIAPLPCDSLNILESPVPIIVGINRSEHYFWRKELNKMNGCIYVFLDSYKINYDEKGMSMENFNTLNFLLPELKNIYSEISDFPHKFEIHNSLQDDLPKKDKKSQFFSRGITRGKTATIHECSSPLLTTKPKKAENQKAVRDFFTKFKELLDAYLIKVVKKFPNYNPTMDQASVIKVIDEETDDMKARRFLYDFKSTLMFGNFTNSVSQVHIKASD